ncbi:MAG: hypothetical protein ABJ239_07295 [Erythrobacter sp.]
MSTHSKTITHSGTTNPSANALTVTSNALKWTQARQAAFLRALASSHSVTEAARAVGMTRQSAYALRARLKREPFDLAWQAALQCRFDALAEAAMERALNGVEVPHFYQGELIHTSRRYDERLTVALLAMRDRFAPRQLPPSYHNQSGYSAEGFGALVHRVEQGPETWSQERQLQHEAFEEEGDEDHAYEEGWDEDLSENWDGEFGSKEL